MSSSAVECSAVHKVMGTLTGIWGMGYGVKGGFRPHRPFRGANVTTTTAAAAAAAVIAIALAAVLIQLLLPSLLLLYLLLLPIPIQMPIQISLSPLLVAFLTDII